LNVLEEVGVDTVGDKRDAGVTGRDVDLFQDRPDTRLAKTGFSGAALESEHRRELLSPSVAVGFFLKLKARRNPPVDEVPLKMPGD
jgi:hypothetical protein